MSASETDTRGNLKPATPTRRRWVTWLLALVIFVAGLVSGVGLTVVVAVHRMRYAMQHPEEAPSRIAKLIERRLSLTEEQRRKVEAIVAARQARLMTLRRQVQPEVMAELDGVRDEITEVLTTEQRERWVRLYASYRENWMPPLPAEGK